MTSGAIPRPWGKGRSASGAHGGDVVRGRDGAGADENGPIDAALAKALREWRLGEAKPRRVPAFRIFTDRVLEGIAAARPRNEAELLAISGVGPKLVESAGARLLELCRGGTG